MKKKNKRNIWIQVHNSRYKCHIEYIYFYLHRFQFLKRNFETKEKNRNYLFNINIFSSSHFRAHISSANWKNRFNILWLRKIKRLLLRFLSCLKQCSEKTSCLKRDTVKIYHQLLGWWLFMNVCEKISCDKTKEPCVSLQESFSIFHSSLLLVKKNSLICGI